MPNWRLKAIMQKILSRLPFAEQINSLMQSSRYVLRLGRSSRVAQTRRRIGLVGKSIHMLAQHVRLEGATVVEVGTGWAPLPTTLLYLCGAGRIHTYDIVRRARFSLSRDMLRVFRQELDACSEALGLPREVISDRLARLEPATTLEDLFAKANIEYYAPGDAASTGLPDKSIDLFYSYAVLDYVPLDVLHAMCREARRLLKPTGRFYAFIGCSDDYASFDRGLHNLDYLKYSDAEWVRLASNAFYFANRMREQEYIDVFQQHGAAVENVVHTLRPEDVAHVKTLKLDDRFRRFTPERNAVVRTEIILSF